MDLAGIEAADLDFVDLYSCFPSAVQIAAWELGLPEERPLTVTGGLTFGGGPLNNYVMHSIARTVELLRDKPDGYGLVTGNGGNLYKHAHGIYSGTPPRHDFQHDDVKAEIAALPSRKCLAEYDGNAAIESYTVMYDNEGPSIGHGRAGRPTALGRGSTPRSGVGRGHGQRGILRSPGERARRATVCLELKRSKGAYMAFFERGEVSLYYEIHGEGYPILLFAPGGMRSAVSFWRVPNGIPSRRCRRTSR